MNPKFLRTPFSQNTPGLLLLEPSFKSLDENFPCKYSFVRFYAIIHNSPKINAYFLSHLKVMLLIISASKRRL